LPARIVAPFLLLVLALSGCSQAGDALDQARDLQQKVENVRWCSDVVRLASAVRSENAEAARNLVDALKRSAPEDLAADVQVVRATVRKIEAGEADAADLPSNKVNAAVRRLLDAAEQRCAGELGDQLSGN
jgi:DNA-binding FrmR family transcriptional regulator